MACDMRGPTVRRLEPNWQRSFPCHLGRSDPQQNYGSALVARRSGHACSPYSFGSIIGPTGGVTVSLHAKGFAHRQPWAAHSRQRKNSPATFDASRRPAQHANARVRPRRHRSLGRRAALTSPKDQLKRERWRRRRRRLFRVSCGRELTGTRALIGKGERAT